MFYSSKPCFCSSVRYLDSYLEKSVQIYFRMHGVTGHIRLHGALILWLRFWLCYYSFMLLKTFLLHMMCLFLSSLLLNCLIFISHVELEHRTELTSNIFRSLCVCMRFKTPWVQDWAMTKKVKNNFILQLLLFLQILYWILILIN